MITKICTKCGVEKALIKDNFTWRNDSQTYRNECKECKSKYHSQYIKNIKKYIKDHPSNKDNSITIFFRFIEKIFIKDNHQYCNICFIEKELNENNFYRRDKGKNWSSKCKKCHSDESAIYYEQNKEEIIKKQALYYNEKSSIRIFLQFLVNISTKDNHKYCITCFTLKELIDDNFSWRNDTEKWANQCKKCNKQYRQDNKDSISKWLAQYYIDNKNTILQRQLKNKSNILKQASISTKLKRKNNPPFRLKRLVSNAIGSMLKSQGGSKQGHSILQYLEWKPQELKDHLSNQFEPWMTWDNQGKYSVKKWDDDNSTWVWNIDHIIPQSDLPYDTMEHPNFKKCWALSNLRPLSAKQNILDGINRTRHEK